MHRARQTRNAIAKFQVRVYCFSEAHHFPICKGHLATHALEENESGFDARQFQRGESGVSIFIHSSLLLKQSKREKKEVLDRDGVVESIETIG